VRVAIVRIQADGFLVLSDGSFQIFRGRESLPKVAAERDIVRIQSDGFTVLGKGLLKVALFPSAILRLFCAMASFGFRRTN